MAIDRGSETTVQLLTLLNVSATRAPKRQRIDEDVGTRQKLNKPRSSQINEEPAAVLGKAGDSMSSEEQKTSEDHIGVVANQAEDGDGEQSKEEEDISATSISDPYEEHYGAESSVLSDNRREVADQKTWTTSKSNYGKLGSVVEYTASDSKADTGQYAGSKTAILSKLHSSFQERQAKIPKELAALQDDLLDMLQSYRDLYITRTSLELHQYQREAIMLHAISHLTKKRRRILKNNERIAHALKADAPAPEDVHDQGFTRPSVLILLPFRSFALRWLSALTSHTPTPSYQIENHSRFQSEFGLPSGAVDKLANADVGTYPRDHVEMFKGNVDDSFRVGIKLTRKSVKLFSEFYGCDIIFASPLGLRISIQKEKNADFLSSIEMLIVDQMDALTMQNWDHVQFIMSHLNQLPKESHNADFSRIKPWYLDGHAEYLRQSIFLTAYETPETRNSFNNLKNVSGKLRTERRWSPVSVPEGIHQEFIKFDCASPQDEADKRFQYFTTQLMPTLLKSAVQSVNTVIFVPSSFDFIRVHNYLRRNTELQFTVLSEYSTNQDISRARQSFFNGKKSFLLVSERFHFFRRYKIRGIRNVVFYGPPDHTQFYTEFLSYPFLEDDVESSDVTCRVLYCKYDWMKLERLAGSDGASGLIKHDRVSIP